MQDIRKDALLKRVVNTNLLVENLKVGTNTKDLGDFLEEFTAGDSLSDTISEKICQLAMAISDDDVFDGESGQFLDIIKKLAKFRYALIDLKL